MTGFDILLVCLICWVIAIIFSYKEVGKPSDFAEWILLLLMSVLVAFLGFLCLCLIGMLISALVQTDWHAFFTQKILTI